MVFSKQTSPIFKYFLHPYPASGGSFFLHFHAAKRKIQFFGVLATALGPISFCSSRNLVQIPLNESSVGASCVELWRSQWSIRISVPMLYITF